MPQTEGKQRVVNVNSLKWAGARHTSLSSYKVWGSEHETAGNE